MWGIGVISLMLLIVRPIPVSALIADSRPCPGPLMNTSTCFKPWSTPALAISSAALCAANAVHFIETLNTALQALP